MHHGRLCDTTGGELLQIRCISMPVGEVQLIHVCQIEDTGSSRTAIWGALRFMTTFEGPCTTSKDASNPSRCRDLTKIVHHQPSEFQC